MSQQEVHTATKSAAKYPIDGSFWPAPAEHGGILIGSGAEGACRIVEKFKPVALGGETHSAGDTGLGGVKPRPPEGARGSARALPCRRLPTLSCQRDANRRPSLTLRFDRYIPLHGKRRE